jgi:glycosyltransferase involved in cell wall biosynthesis
LKKALILAYDFPPFNSIGAQRPYSWFKYFKEFGIEPILITRHWDREITGPDDCNLPSLNTEVISEESKFGKVIRAPFFPSLRDRLISKTNLPTVLFRKGLSVWQLLTEHYFESSDNKIPIYRAARDFLQSNKVDVIIACGEPFVLFRYASELSKEFAIPWIGDYRDGWSTNYRWDDAKVYGLIQKSVQQRVEKHVTESADMLTTAAPSFSKRIAKLTGRNEEGIPVVYNGYFEDLFDGLDDVPEKKTFHAVHAGTLYYFQRVETYLDGLNLFLENYPDAEIETTFFGLNFYPAQIDRIKASVGKAKVKFTDKIPHEKMLAELASSHLQLLVATPEKHQIYGKVFDYLASGRPTLMVENDKGPLEWILSHQENSYNASTAEEVSDYIEELYFNRDKTKRLPRSENQFSRRKQTERFAKLILETLNKQQA